MKSHALYRFYGDTGQLLYVGISSDPARRFGQHAATKSWWHSVRGISLDWYSSREDAGAAERRAITVERPLMNVQRPSVKGAPTKRCGHCETCSAPEDYDYCGLLEDGLKECPKCGSDRCVYVVGHQDGSIDGYLYADSLTRQVGP